MMDEHPLSQSYSEGYPDHRGGRVGRRMGGREGVEGVGDGGVEGIMRRLQSENEYLRDRLKSFEKGLGTLFQVC